MEKDTTPLVSICMPAYNAGKYIAEAIRSIIAQTYHNWELIIINDGSTDHTSLEVSKITDHRVKIYHQENKGQCAAANEAFRYSSGKLIKFMDADDILSPNFIAEQVSAIATQKDCIAYSSWGRFYNDDLSTLKVDTDQVQKNLKPVDWLVQSMTNNPAMLQCGLWLIPRSILTKSGLWNEKLSLINDFEFFIRVLLHAEKLIFGNNAILYYRSGNHQTLSATNDFKAALSAYNSIDWGTQHLLKHENSDRMQKIAADCFQRFVYTFYPEHQLLTTKAEEKISALGGSILPFPSGGYTNLLARLFGWKNTVKIKRLVKAI